MVRLTSLVSDNGEYNYPMSDKRRIEARITGIVQGVGFRGTTIQVARSLALTGWVKNLRDGSVSTVAEGEQGALESFIQFLHARPRSARVANVEVEWLPATDEFHHFTVDL